MNLEFMFYIKKGGMQNVKSKFFRLDFTILMLAKHSEKSHQFCFYFSSHDFVTIFWCPDKMLLVIP